MANKRMFSKDIVDTDKFLDMPVTSQALYFHLGMHADDDGFVSSPKKILKIANCTNDDLRILVAKEYIIPFESGVVVITDWKANNFIRKDRYKPTTYRKEQAQLSVVENRYCLNAVDTLDAIPMVNQDVTNRHTQVRLGKDSIDNNTYIVEQSPTVYPYKEIIDYLNQQTGKKFRYTTSKNQRHIKARIDEGFTVDDFKQVIDTKVAAWSKGEMEKYLRPETLFGTKFEGYLNEVPARRKETVYAESASSTKLW